MRIAVYTKSLRSDKNTWQEDDRFIYETLKRLISAHPGHEFVIIYDSPGDTSFFAADNLLQIILSPAGNSPLALYRRLNRKLPAILKKQHADVLLSMTGLLPLRIPVPSCLVIEDISFTAKTTGSADVHARYRKKYFQRYLPEANSVATVSDYCKQQLISRFKILEDKITVVHKGARENCHPLGWEEREAVKNDYTDGREYLIYVGAIHPEKNIINLMKAFSMLKKRLRSNMVLVLAGTLDPGYKDFPELLRTYQFRDDIKIPEHTGYAEMAGLIGAAYALVCPSVSENFGTSVLEALKCRVPVLAAMGGALEEAGGEAAVYFDASIVEDMGNIFCEIYKNENLRARLIASADVQAAKFTWDSTADLLWLCLLQAGK